MTREIFLKIFEKRNKITTFQTTVLIIIINPELLIPPSKKYAIATKYLVY